MKYTMKDSIRWLNKWDPISQKHYKVLQVLTVSSRVDNKTQQKTFDEIWTDVPIIEEEE